jgi:hypothetical protein
MTTSPRPTCLRRVLPPALLALAPLLTQAQSFPISAPQLPSRSAAGAKPQAATSGQGSPHAGYGGNSATPAYGNNNQPYSNQAYGNNNYATTAQVPKPATAGAGPCRVQPSPERQSLALVTGSGNDAPAKSHVALGEFRAQSVVHSPDGLWAVAFTKLRGALQFAAMTIDLTQCAVQNTIDLPAAGTDAEFLDNEAVLRFAGGERKVNLRNGSAR